MSQTITRRHLLIHGKVQGVYYRASAQAKARELGLSGWVRNLRSGEVEALACGPETAVQAFIDWAHEGPPAARVTRVDSAPAEFSDTGEFELRPTA